MRGTVANWTPTWQANTAYTLTAVVIPTSTTFAGYTWRCTTAGTSGNTEPTWPTDPSVTPTVTDGGVTWSVGTGFRQAIQYGIGSLVQTFATANPTIIRRVMTVRPRAFVEFPTFYVGDLNETIDTSAGVRTRTFTGFSCYLVDFLGEQIESNDRMNFAADVLTDLFTLNYHAISGRSILQHIATNDTEVTDEAGAVVYPALEFQFGLTKLAEGRN